MSYTKIHTKKWILVFSFCRFELKRDQAVIFVGEYILGEKFSEFNMLVLSAKTFWSQKIRADFRDLEVSPFLVNFGLLQSKKDITFIGQPTKE